MDEREEQDVEEAAPGEVPWQHDPDLPADARRMGLSPLVPDGAMLQFAGSLNSTKTSHRVVAWVLLAVFLVPVLLTVLRVLGGA